MKKLINLLPLMVAFLIVSCEDKNDDNENELAIKEITTSNVSEGAYYFNLGDGVQNSDSWHLAYDNLDAGGGFSMPSFSLSNSSMLAVESTMDFEAIEVSPAQNAFSPENGRMQYGVANAAVTYNMTSHQDGVSSDTYIIYDTVTHKVYKVRFDDYSCGVVVFRFAKLN